MCDRLCNKLSVLIGLLDFLDVYKYFLSGKLCDFVLCNFDLLTALSDDNTGLCGIDDNLNSVGSSFDLDLAYAACVKLLLKLLSDVVIFYQIIREF